MIYKLRNRHFYTWVILALLLPLGFLVGLKTIPGEKFGETISHQNPSELSMTVLHLDDFVKVSILRDGLVPGVEITLQKALMVPAAIVYLDADASDDIENAQILGKLDSKNSYYFRVSSPIIEGQQLLFYDPINKVVFHKIVL